MARQVQKTTLTTTVYNQLRSKILLGEFKPGDKLRIDALAEKFEVGNNAVREALSRLSSERLVDRVDQRGFSIPSIDLSEWRELVRTRIFLETHVLRSSMSRRTDAWEESVALSFHKLVRVKRDSPAERSDWEDAHRAFHRSLLANGDSHWLIEFCEVLADQSTRYISISNGYQLIKRDGHAEHEEIMKATLYGAVDDACDLLSQHYMLTLENLEGQLSVNI